VGFFGLQHSISLGETSVWKNLRLCSVSGFVSKIERSLIRNIVPYEGFSIIFKPASLPKVDENEQYEDENKAVLASA
jgi:hypothetical protein